MVIEKEKNGRISMSSTLAWSMLVVIVGATASGGLFGGRVQSELSNLSSLLSDHITAHASEAKTDSSFKQAIERRVDHVERESGNGSVRLEAIKESLGDLKAEQRAIRSEQGQIIRLLQEIKRGGAVR